MQTIGLLVLRLGFASLLLGFHGWTRLGRAIGYLAPEVALGGAIVSAGLTRSTSFTTASR